MDLLADSEKLYADCRSTDPITQAEAYTTLWHYLYRVALQVTYHQPDAEAVAQDCAQIALVRIHERIDTCHNPKAFRTWARRIVSHVAIDELRRQKRLVPLETSLPTGEERQWVDTHTPSPEERVQTAVQLTTLRQLLTIAPISDRSRRVVVGRYVDGTADEKLADRESELADKEVRPSHIQVTRAKNITKLRQWSPLHTFLQAEA